MKNNEVPPKVGDRLFTLAVGNAARRQESGYHEWYIVQKVGKKYFYAVNERWVIPGEVISERSMTKFDLETWSESNGYSACWICYSTEQEYRDEAEIDRLCDKISEAFQYRRNPGLDAEQLRTIGKMLDDIKPKAKS